MPYLKLVHLSNAVRHYINDLDAITYHTCPIAIFKSDFISLTLFDALCKTWFNIIEQIKYYSNTCRGGSYKSPRVMYEHTLSPLQIGRNLYLFLGMLESRNPLLNFLSTGTCKLLSNSTDAIGQVLQWLEKLYTIWQRLCHIEHGQLRAMVDSNSIITSPCLLWSTRL